MQLRDIWAVALELSKDWFWVVSGVVSALTIAFLINRYTPNEFKLTTTVAIDEIENPLASSIDGMLDLGFGGNGIIDTRVAVQGRFRTI